MKLASTLQRPVLLVVICLSSFHAKPQSDTIISNKGHFFVAYNPVNYLFKKTFGYVEYFYKADRSIALEGGYGAHLNDTYIFFPWTVYNEYTAKISVLNYDEITRRRFRYRGLQLIGKKQWNDKVDYDPGGFAGSCDSRVYHQSMKAQVVAIQYIAGEKFVFRPFVFEFFLGVGAMVKLHQTRIHSSDRACGGEHAEENKNERFGYPFFSSSLGIRLGLRL